MKSSGWVGVLALVLAVAAAPLSAHAQQAPGYLNPFDQTSDFPSNWYWYGDPFPWAVDGTPASGHSGGASLNWNNGTDMAGYYPYGYWYTSAINLSQYTTPVLSFWCRWDMDPDPYWHYREIYVYETQNYQYYYAVFNDDLDCGAENEWHQHLITLPQSLNSSSNVVFQFYTYLNDSDGAGYEGWFIDDLAILVPDITPPDPISDLAASNATLTEIQLDWSAPHDDDISGVTASYDLRYSTSAITDANFNSATQVNGEPTPDVQGTPHTLLVTGLTENTTYHFAIRTTDIAGNVSTVSNVPSLATLAPPPPPPSGSGAGGPSLPKETRDILPCSSGTTAAPTGLLALAGLIALAFVVRRK